MAFLPLFLFVILFGLSMDYHVFILSRIREAYDRGMKTEDAVAHGIKTTAGVVTSAAIVMVFVFGIFATLSIVMLKQFGVGLADRRPDRRDDRPGRPAAGGDEAARRLELVPAALARVAAAPRARAVGRRGGGRGARARPARSLTRENWGPAPSSGPRPAPIRDGPQAPRPALSCPAPGAVPPPRLGRVRARLETAHRRAAPE